MELEETYNNIRRKLHGLRQREKILAMLSGSFLCLAVLFGAGFCLLVGEGIFWFSIDVRTLLVAGFLVLGFGIMGWRIGVPLFSLLFRKSLPDDDSLGLRTGNAFPQIKDRLTDAIQVYRTRIREAHRTSLSLALACLKDVYKKIESLDFSRVASTRGLFRSMRIAVFIIGFCLLVVGIFPRSLGNALNRIVHPRQFFSVPAPFQLTLYPGNVRVIQGEDVDISVKSEGEVPSELSLFLIEVGESAIEKILRRPFSYQILSVKRSLDYFVRAEKVRTPTFRIDVVQRPIIRTIRVKLLPPSYAKLGIMVQEPNAGEVEALKGTKVEVLVKTNKILSTACLVFEKGKRREMSVRGRETVGGFVVKQEDKYWVELKDTLGIENLNPISYYIRVQEDLAPVCKILFPGKNVDLDESMTLPLALEAEDDFGLSQCRIGYWIHRGETADTCAKDTMFVPLTIEQREPTRVLLNYLWNMETLNLIPEDVVSYFFEVLDNDRISGPKRARSWTFTARFPSIYEIFQEVEADQADQVESLLEIYKETQNFKQELERISEEMKGGKKLEWEERKKLEKMSEDQQRLEKKVDYLKERLDEVVDRMERNDLLTLETLAKYQELQKLFEEISSPEMLEAMKKLQKALEQVSQAELKKAMEQFKLSQEGFLKAIERTISLLKRLQVEQKVDELVKRIEDLVQRQGEVNQKLAQDKDLSKLAGDQGKIGEDAEALRQEMDKLMQKMGELPNMPLDQLGAIMDFMDRENLMGQLAMAEQMMKAGQRKEAGASGSKSKQTMVSMADMLKDLQKRLQENQKQKVAAALRRASYRLIHLSQAQEELMLRIKQGNITKNKAASEQLSLVSGLSQVLDSLYQLSQETFFVTPEMGKALSEAQSQMNQAIQRMEQTRGMNVSIHQVKAMGGLNRAVMAIQDAMDQLAGASSGLGMEQYFLQLQQMGEQQMGINQQLQDLLQRGQLTLAEQAAMSRLAAEQEAVKRSLEDFLKEFGERSEVPGRLDQLAEEMEAVVEELKQRKASQETIRRQERILSRLLDAQHSLRRRDYSRKRQAITGKDFVRRSPASLPSLKSGLKDRIRRDILRMVKEGYTRDYQELIRRYFEALVEEGGR